MRAKEQADEIVERRLALRPGDGYMGIAWDIAKAIEAAVKEEREACKYIAHKFTMYGSSMQAATAQKIVIDKRGQA